MAFRFTLAGFRSIKVTPDMKTIFHNIVANKELLMKVTPFEENRTIQYCELYLNGRSVRDLIKEQLAKQTVIYEYSKLHVPHRGAVERVIVCYVESPTRILVQLESNNDTLNTLMSCVAVHCTAAAANALKYEQLKENMPVCSFYPCDSTWYRAQIKEFNETEATVLFVDYGNEDVVPISMLQRISQDLVVKVRTQALECCLAGFEMSQPNQDIADKLYSIINEKTLTMQVLEVMKNQVLIVNLLDNNNVNVASYLKSATSPVMKTALTSVDDNNGWVDEPPPNQSQITNRSKPYEPQLSEDRFIIKTQNDSAKNRYQKSRFSNHRSSNNKAWNDRGDFRKNFSNDDSRRNWRNKDETSPREKDRFFHDDRRSGRFSKDENKSFYSKDDPIANRYNKQRSDEDRGPKKWDRFSDTRNNDKSQSPRKWERSGDDNRSSNDRGYRKWDRPGDDRQGSDDRAPKKWDKSSDNRSFDDRFKNREGGDASGYNRRFKDNDSFGDRPRRFDDAKNKNDSEDSWASRPKWKGTDDNKESNFKGRGGDFSTRGSYESKPSFGRQTNESMYASIKKAIVPYQTISLGDKELIEVVYSINPVEFFVQNIKFKDELEKTASSLAMACETGTQLSNPEKGMYCAAMYSEDGVWYRACIESVSGTKATVKFIDYGNGEEIDFDNLRVLPNELCDLPAQAIKCGLLGACANAEDGGWSDIEQTEFAIATEGKLLQAELKYKLFSNNTFQIVLADITEGENNAIIINYMFNGTEELISSINPPISGPFTLAPFHLKSGEMLDVQITWFISPNSFYAQPINTNGEFKAMMEHIQEHFKTFKHVLPFTVKTGKYVLARYKDDKVLYRAVITDVNAVSGNLVHFVDYGNSEFVVTNQMYEINSEYALMPCQALSCSLAGVKPFEEGWPKLGTTNIESFFNADLYTCTVLAEGEDGSYIVSLGNQEGNSVSDLLINNGLALSDGTSYNAQLCDGKFNFLVHNSVSNISDKVKRVLVSYGLLDKKL